MGLESENIPSLRFPEFDTDWDLKKIKDIGSVRSGSTPLRSKSEYFRGGDIYWVKTTDLNNSKIVDTEEKVTNLALEETSLKLFPIGSVLVAMYGGFNQIGRTGILTVEAATNQALSVINTNSSITPEYLIAWLNAKVYVWRKFAGSSRKDPNITGSDVGSFPIAFPSLPEQQKIADFLSAVDKKIQLLTRKKELLEEYKKGVMQKIFSREIRFKDENGREFTDWEEKRLGDILNFFTTNSFSRNDLTFINSGVKNIHYGDIHTKFKSRVNTAKEDIPFIKSEISLGKFPSDSYCLEGDIVIADASEDYTDIGKAIEIIEIGLDKVLAGLHTIHARDISRVTAIGYKSYLFQTYKVREQIMKQAQGISVLGISKKSIANVLVDLPCLDEQTMIVNLLSSLDQKIQATQSQISLTQQFKKGLLQQMFI